MQRMRRKTNAMHEEVDRCMNDGSRMANGMRLCDETEIMK